MMRLTRHGLVEMLIGSAVLMAAIVLIGVFAPGLWALFALVPFALLVWLLAFFRDPDRDIPLDPQVMVSPADGTVADITELSECDLVAGPALRIGIFLSVFNVHINRSPCSGKVLKVEYARGKFINAMSHTRASEENERNTIVLGDPKDGRPIAAVRQIVGLIARRIICSAVVGDDLARGQRIGMIKFGSRTELYVPKWMNPQAAVKIGDKVRGGADVIVRLAPGN